MSKAVASGEQDPTDRHNSFPPLLIFGSLDFTPISLDGRSRR